MPNSSAGYIKKVSFVRSPNWNMKVSMPEVCIPHSQCSNCRAYRILQIVAIWKIPWKGTNQNQNLRPPVNEDQRFSASAPMTENLRNLKRERGREMQSHVNHLKWGSWCLSSKLGGKRKIRWTLKMGQKAVKLLPEVGRQNRTFEDL